MSSLLAQLQGKATPPKAETSATPAPVKPETKAVEAPAGDDAKEALGKAKRMVALGIMAQEIVNGLQGMFPKLATADLQGIVEVAQMTTVNTKAAPADVPKGNTPAQEPGTPDTSAVKEDAKEGPAKRGRPAKTESAPVADRSAADIAPARSAVLALIENTAKGALDNDTTFESRASIASFLASALKGL